MAPFDDIVRFTRDRRFVTPISPCRSSPISLSVFSIFSILFLSSKVRGEEVCALSDQKHENAGEPRLRPAETMKANTGNAKLPGTKERKSGHCELQRTVRKSTIDIQFGQTRETNEKKGGKKKNGTDARVLANYERRVCARARKRPPILPKTIDFGTDIDSRRRYRHIPDFSGCPTSGTGMGIDCGQK